MNPLKLRDIERRTNGAVKLNLLSVEGWDDFFSAGKKLTAAKAFATQAWFRRAVDLRAAALASVPFTIERGPTTVWDSTTEPEAPDELAFFAKAKEILSLAEASMVCEGAAYFFKIYDNSTRPTGLQYWASPTITPVVTRDGLQGFRRQIGNDSRIYMREDIVFLRPMSPYVEVGVAPSEGAAARVNADVLASMDSFLDSFLDSGLISATVLMTKRPVGDKEKSNFLELWRSRFRRKTNQDPLIVNAQDAELQQIGGSLADLANTAISDDQRKSIAAAFGIPASLLFSDAANYATKERDQLDFVTYTVRPRAELIESQLNDQLFSDLGYRFNFAFHRLEALQVEETKKAQAAAQYGTMLIALVEAGLLTPDEARGIVLQVLDVPSPAGVKADESISRTTPWTTPKRMVLNGTG